MKSKNKLKKIILSLILCINFTLIVSGQTKDSIKFSIEESRNLIDAWQTLPNYVIIVDSLRSAEVILKNDIERCNELKNDYKAQNKAYQKYAEDISKEIDKQDKKIKKLNFWIRFWKGMTGGVGLVCSTVIIIKEVKD